MNECHNGPHSHFEVGVVIIRRGLADKAAAIANESGAVGGTIFFGIGTAKNSLLDLYGLEKQNEYEILMVSFVSHKRREVMEKLKSAMNLEQPGKGIMFTMPSLGSAGINILRQFLEQKNIPLPRASEGPKEEIERMSSREFVLIISMINRGFADEAMDAVRELGGEGGIIINGRGAGIDTCERFFGISIGQEREVLMNLVEKSKMQQILKALVTKVGIKTDARGVSFVMPVEDAVGVVRLDEAKK